MWGVHQIFWDKGNIDMYLEPFSTRVINMDNADYEIKYYRSTNFKGLTIYSSKIDLGRDDKIILDDYSIDGLEDKLRLIFPAALYIRTGLNRKENNGEKDNEK